MATAPQRLHTILGHRFRPYSCCIGLDSIQAQAANPLPYLTLPYLTVFYFAQSLIRPILVATGAGRTESRQIPKM